MATQATPGRESMGSDVSQSLIARVVAGIKYAVSGVGPDNFFGPAQPIAPQAQERTEGRQMDYPVGYNLRMRPREGEAVSFETLRQLADGYDLLRLIIETRKDQVEAFDWEIVAYDETDTGDNTAEIKRVTQFLESPDKEHDWPQWLRMQLEDLLVLDAISVYPRKSRGGELYGFEIIDPATLKRILDDSGRTPVPPDVAFQQVLKGIPTADYSSDMIAYTMRNPRSNRVYGFSPVEQVMMTVNIAMRRQLSQLDFYTQGNIPEALAQVPDNWSMDMVKEFQLWWDSVLEGNQAQKRKMRFLPKLDNIVFPKQDVMKDEYDEWLARIICFCFSIPPSAFVRQVNRASGEQMADTAKEEGLMPLLRFMSLHVTRLVRRHLNAPSIRFQFKIVNRVAPEQQATIHKIYMDTEVMTPDEVRTELELEPLSAAEREAAWPTPVAPGMNPDGSPILPMGAPGAKPPVAPGAAGDGAPPFGKPKAANDDTAATPPSAAEKMLAKMIEQWEPEQLVKMIEKLRPQIIQMRPEVNVEVGDTNVHVPAVRTS